MNSNITYKYPRKENRRWLRNQTHREIVQKTKVELHASQYRTRTQKKGEEPRMIAAKPVPIDLSLSSILRLT